MNYSVAKLSDAVVFSYRVYHRRGITFKTYIARIVGPHSNYYLDRAFDIRCHEQNNRFDTIRYVLETGIYEYVIKRYKDDRLFQKERMWVVVCGTDVYCYADDEMNYQYVLYTQYLLSGDRPLPITSVMTAVSANSKRNAHGQKETGSCRCPRNS